MSAPHLPHVEALAQALTDEIRAAAPSTRSL